ncbi:hypothetical protein [Streptomyces violascens]|uniref:hypothetical protein n=1 Tax=Streptomyces violascens TaxID=67381 RepID=UPI00368592C4
MKARPTHTPQPKRNKLLTRTIAAAAAAGTLAWLAATGTGVASQGTAPAAAEQPGSTVEHFDYPNAEKILAEKNIVLKRGDGHITLVDCASGTGFIEIRAREKPKSCFKVTGNSGWLTMELPSVHLIKGNDYNTKADMTLGTVEKTFDITKDEWTPVGETADPGHQYALVELRATK